MTIKRKPVATVSVTRSRARKAATAVPSASRAPQHARGRERVERILDAATEIMLGEGVIGLTIEAIAKRSGTAKSSMYHFFRDRDCVITALADRVVARVVDELEKPGSPPENILELNPEEVVDLILEPILSFMGRYPEVLLIMPQISPAERAMSDKAGVEHLEISRIDRILAARIPAARVSERRAFSSALFACIVGAFQVGSTQPAVRAGLLRENRAMMIAALAAFEQRPRS